MVTKKYLHDITMWIQCIYGPQSLKANTVFSKLPGIIPLLSDGDVCVSEVLAASLGGLKAENAVSAGCDDCLTNLCRGY